MERELSQFYYKSNRLQQLRGFCYAAQFGNISKAAGFMGLSQATVSLQIKALEHALRAKLFERNGPRIRLTEDGQRLLELALPHIEGIDNLHSVFDQNVQHRKRTELAIAANSTALNFILPGLLKTYLERFPDVYATIHYAEHHEALEKLLKEEVEIAVLPKREHLPFPQQVIYHPAFRFMPSLITRRDHPLAGRKHLTVREISKYELTLPDEELRVIPNLYDIFSANQASKRLRVNFVNWETTRKYIEAGLAISISSDVIIGANDILVATPLPHMFEPVSYGFVMKRRRQVPEKLERLLDIARHASERGNIRI